MADFDIASASQGDVLLLTFTGKSTEQNAAAMTRRYFKMVLGSGLKKAIADIRQLRGRLSSASTYFLVRDLPVQPVPSDIQTAIVESAENREYAAFLETTAANAGVHFKTFLDYDEALNWIGRPG